MTVHTGWELLLALFLLLGLATAYSRWAGLGLERHQVIAFVRAIVQLAVVSLLIVAAVQYVWSALVFVAGMFAIAVWTAAGRAEVRPAIGWVAVAMAWGILPTLMIIFLSGASPFTGQAIVPISGIIIGSAMTGHTLVTRRAFPALRDHLGTYEAALALGFERPWAIREVVHPHIGEALIPNLDQTRTVGLVTLPGAFIGVLLGGGTPIQAGASQLLVLIGIMATQAGVVVAARRLMCAGKLLPADLRERLRP